MYICGTYGLPPAIYVMLVFMVEALAAEPPCICLAMPAVKLLLMPGGPLVDMDFAFVLPGPF